MPEDDKVVSLDVHRIKKVVTEQTGLTDENSNLSEAIGDAIERNKVYRFLEKKEERRLLEECGIDPQHCDNGACRDFDIESGKCASEFNPTGCIFRMLTPPPNSLDYDEYMPTHKEALDRLEARGLLKGDRQRYLEESARYGKPQDNAGRDAYVFNGVSRGQLEKALLIVLEELSDDGGKTPFTLKDSGDREIIARNVCNEVEKIVGVFPNIG